MRTREVRALTDEQLARELESTYKELQNLRFQQATKQLASPAQMRKTRLTLARLKTIMRQRQLNQTAVEGV